MTTPDLTGDRVVPDTFASRPPMPSIAASALLESRMFIARTRRTVADWLTRTDRRSDAGTLQTERAGTKQARA